MKHSQRILTLVAALLSSLTSMAQLNTDRLIAIGRNALYFDDYVLSIQYFNQVIKLKPYLAEPYLYRAIAKIQLGDMVGANADCSSAITCNPFMPGAYYARGFVCMQQGKYAEAEQDLTEALIFSPENRTYLMLRAESRSQQEKYPLAMEDIETLLHREPRNPAIHFEKGLISLAQKDTASAKDCFLQASQYDSQNPQNWSALGMVSMMQQDDDHAMQYLTKAINLGSKWAGDYINRGILHYHLHNFRSALADYDEAIHLNSQDPQCYYNRGVLRAELGDYNRALADIDQAISLEPDNTQMHYQHGLICLQLRQWNDALQDFDQLIECYPYFLPSYYLAAQAKTALNDPKAAYQYQQKAHELEENKEQIMQQQKSINTDVQIAQSQPRKKDHTKQFSTYAAQNQQETDETQKYDSQTRGTIQKRYTDVVNEGNVVLSYYTKQQPLRKTELYHYTIDNYNKLHLLPSPLHLTTQEIALTADMVAEHFNSIDHLSATIDQYTQSGITAGLADIYFARAIEFAIVQDYTSAIDDCTKAITISSTQQNENPLLYFCRANWRYKYLEYQRSTGEIYDDKASGMLDFELTLRDYDQVIRLVPDFAYAYYNKANILCTQKDYQTAIDNYTTAISYEKDFAEAYFNRGLTRIFIDQNAEGIADLSKAGELGIYQSYNLITRLQD